MFAIDGLSGASQVSSLYNNSQLYASPSAASVQSFNQLLSGADSSTCSTSQNASRCNATGNAQDVSATQSDLIAQLLQQLIQLIQQSQSTDGSNTQQTGTSTESCGKSQRNSNEGVHASKHSNGDNHSGTAQHTTCS